MRYEGVFLEDIDDEVENLVAMDYVGGSAALIFGDLGAILSSRSFADLHRIAVHVDAVVQRQAELIESRAHGDDVDRALRAARIDPQDPKWALKVRRSRGDADLWLAAGAENGAPTDDDFPANVARAEYLAVLALWKGILLSRATADSMRGLRSMPQADPESGPGARAQAKFFLNAAAGVYALGSLAAEFARAGTLASEAHYLAHQLKNAKEEAKQALKEAADHRLKEAGALGGHRRAERYAPAKARAAELYRAGAFPSRNQAADSIYRTLTEEGFAVSHRFVLNTLTAVDKTIEAKRTGL